MTRLMALLIGITIATNSNAAIVNLSTSESPFDVGTLNQGWWSPTEPNTDTTDSIHTGRLGIADLRSFFTFDLSLSMPGTINSAKLTITRGFSGNNDPTETVEFWNVTTAADVLNDNVGTNFGIYSDLGTGTSYGQFDVPGSGANADLLNFDLNANAITALQGAGGYFSIGASLISSDNFDDALFSGNPGSEVTLTLDITAIPEPTSAALLSLGFAVSILSRRRRT